MGGCLHFLAGAEKKILMINCYFYSIVSDVILNKWNCFGLINYNPIS